MSNSTDLDNKVSRWLARDPDPEMRKELSVLLSSDDREEITQRFSGRLEFGTAGLRGVVGARMNSLVIRETSAGLGNYLLNNIAHTTDRGVLLAYDGRIDSKTFAEDAACVFAGLGIKVFLTDRMTPTPVAAFGIKRLNCAAGVVVTASHNPPEYNGYKVYWENGAQIAPPHDQGIANEIEKYASNDIPWMDYDTAININRISLLDNDYYDNYCQAIFSSTLFQAPPNLPTITLAYSAMHGVGAVMAERLLSQSGFCQIYSVTSQREPDGNFPTVRFPNPEIPGSMDAVIELAKQKNTMLACANDPDADRLAVAVKTECGEYQILSGDQIGVLLGAYLLKKPHSGTHIVCTTIVSSQMLKKIAAANSAEYHETLTGFKWLANVAQSKERDDHTFLFAYEEALGYAIGRTVWDKDGLSALLAFVQMTSEMAAKNKTVLGELERLYKEFGLHVSVQKSMYLQPGTTDIIDLLRKTPLTHIAGRPLDITEDIKHSIRQYANGRTEKIDLPSSNAIIYRLHGGGRIIVRPSGTEPKLKCYYELVRRLEDGNIFSEFEKNARDELEIIANEFQITLTRLLD